jgi:uncharacterized repeat protein (TIGR04076 family)
MKRHKIKVKVVKILEKGTCPDGLKIGDESVFERMPPPNYSIGPITPSFPLSPL